MVYEVVIEFVYVVFQPEDRTCQKEGLCDVHERATGHITMGEI